MFLRVLPYFISFLFGLIMYSLVIFEMVPEALDDIMVAISANLIGVTMIFITYELTKEITDAKLKVKSEIIIKSTIKHNLLDLISFMNVILKNQQKFSKLSTNDLVDFFSLDTERLEEYVSKIKVGKKLNFCFRYQNLIELEELVNNKIYVDVLDQKTIIELLEVIRSAGSLLKRFEDGTYKESKPLIADRISNFLSSSEFLLGYAEVI